MSGKNSVSPFRLEVKTTESSSSPQVLHLVKRISFDLLMHSEIKVINEIIFMSYLSAEDFLIYKEAPI